MTINKRFTQLNNSGSNHNLLDALSGKITGSLEVTGSAYFPGGLSGSLQMLTDGTTMFLTGAGGITITNLANGQIEVSSSVSAGAASPEYWTSDVANAIWTSGSVLARGGDTTTAASDYGTDTFFFVSGAIDGVTDGNGVAAFGGDVVVSGNLYISGVNPNTSLPTGLIVFGDANLYRSLYVGSDATDIASFNSQLTASAGIDTPTIGNAGGNVVTVISPLTASVGLEITGSSAFAAGSTFTFNGNGVFAAGLTGSLQEVSAGVPYLLAGDYITIATNSLGQIEITGSAGAASPEYWSSTTAAAIFTTGSVLIRSDDGSGTDAASDYGADTFFFVSGAFGGIGSSGVAAFGGDLVVSGSMRIGDGGNAVGGGGDLFVSGAISVGNPGIPGASITVVTSDVNTNITINSTDDKSIVISNNSLNPGSDDMTISSGSVIIRQQFGSGGGEKPVLTIDANTIAYTALTPDTLGIISDGDITLDAIDSIFVTASNGMYVGANTVFNAGLTGSLQEVSAGVPYLLAGDYITIATNSLGQIEISASNVPGSEVYWSSEAAGEIFTSASLVNVPSGSVHAQFLSASNGMEVTGAASFSPAGTGRGLLNFGGLDIGPITGSMIVYSGESGGAVLSGNLVSASYGIPNIPGDTAVIRHELHVIATSANGGSGYQMFAATYLVMSFVDASGVQTVKAVTELSRETSGSFADTWDVNFNENCEVAVSGAGESNPVHWYGQRVKEMSIDTSGYVS